MAMMTMIFRETHQHRDEKERPSRDCRTRSRAPFRAALLRVRSFLALGRRHSCTPPPSPPRARALHRATGRLTVSGKGSVFGAGRAEDSASRAPRFQTEFCLGQCAEAGRRRHGVLRLTPNALPPSGSGFRGQNRNLSLISVAERNQHRHSMTPGRLAAVKDRGCPPILACGG